MKISRVLFTAVVLLGLCIEGYSQSKTLNGEVKTKSGEAIGGATVTLEKTESSTETDDSGKFTLQIPDSIKKPALLITKDGYNAAKAKVGKPEKGVFITLKPVSTNDDAMAAESAEVSEDTTSQEPEEVISLGMAYMTRGKKHATSNFGEIDGDVFEEAPVSTFDEAMQGRVSGVHVTQSGSAIVGGAVRTMVRGTNSIFAGTEPLYVVDGVPIIGDYMGVINSNNGGMPPGGFYDANERTSRPYAKDDPYATLASNPLAFINPNDIESVTVLKDADATAIYGGRGANGVILINTKRGLVAEDTGYTTIDYNYSVSSVSKKLDYIDGPAWMNMADQGKRNKGIDEGFMPLPGYGVSTRALSREDALRTNTNWLDRVYNDNAKSHEVNVSAARGFKGGRFFLSAAYKNMNGAIQGSKMDRFSTRTNVDFTITKKLKAFAGFNFASTVQERPVLNRTMYMATGSPLADYGASSSMNLNHPFGTSFVGLPSSGSGQVPYYSFPLGALPFVPIDSAGSSWNSRDGNNIVSNQNRQLLRNDNTEYRTVATTGLEYDIIDGLKFNVRANFEYIHNYNVHFISNLIDNMAWEPLNADNQYSAGDKAVERERTVYNVGVVSTLDYQKSYLNNKLVLTLTGGYEYLQQSFRQEQVGANGVTTNRRDVGQVNQTAQNGIRLIDATTYKPITHTSFFARNYYSVLDKYSIGFTLRNDKAGHFGDQSELFYSIGGGWLISNESFLKDNKILSHLKLRASYGKTGNAMIDPSVYTPRYDYLANSDPSGNGILDSVLVAGNEKIRWEISNTLDASVEVGILKNRVTLAAGYYSILTSNLLFPTYPVPANATNSSINTEQTYWNNISGEIVNNGWEFTLTTVNVNTEKIRWSTSFNFTTNQNRINSIGDMSAAGRDARVDRALWVVNEDIIQGNSTNAPLTFASVGGSIGEFILPEYAGIDASSGLEMIYEMDIEHYRQTGQTRRTGNVIRASQENIQAHRFKQEGKSGLPTYWGGITSMLEAYGFDFMLHFSFSGGNYIYDMEEASSSYMDRGLTPIRSSASDTWSPTNTSAKYPVAVYSLEGKDLDDATTGRYTDRFFYKGDYFRLRTVQLAYNFPMIKKVGLRVYYSVQNLLTISGYEGYSPEFSTPYQNAQMRNVGQGIMWGSIPQAVTHNMGLSLTF